MLVDGQPPGLRTRLLRFFMYFTVQSNILVLVGAVKLVRDPARDGGASASSG